MLRRSLFVCAIAIAFVISASSVQSASTPAPRKLIAITFDDGPAEETLAVLDVLKKHNVKATFFLVGKMISGREQIIQTAKKDGHEFGNHTFSHPSLLFKSKKYKAIVVLLFP